jgi:hypothetical protein
MVFPRPEIKHHDFYCGMIGQNFDRVETVGKIQLKVMMYKASSET